MIQANRTEPILTARKTPPKRYFNIVVAGEFNAGKSSVLNVLLRKEVVPVSLGISGLPPVRILPSATESCDICSSEPERRLAKSDLFDEASDTQISSITITTPLEDFQDAAFHEVSVDQNGELSAKSQEILAKADLLIWCTMGQRAWCLSEISIVEKLPQPLLDTAILAVTRSDYLRNTDDLAKVQQRLSRKAGQYFNTILSLDCSRKSIANILDQTVWEHSGGKGLRDFVLSEYRKSPLFGKVRLFTSNDTPDIAAACQSAGTLSYAEVTAAWLSELDTMENWLVSRPAANDRQFARHVHNRLIAFSDAMLPVVDPDKANNSYLSAFGKAAHYLDNALSEQEQANVALVATDLALQLLGELDSLVGNGRLSTT